MLLKDSPRAYLLTLEKFLSPPLASKLAYCLYRYRFLLTYILIGIVSLLVEASVFRALMRVFESELIGISGGVASGIAFAFWVNVKFNFEIPTNQYYKSFIYFTTISLLSASINFSCKPHLESFGFTYEESRFTLSSCLFFFAYLLHRKLSFAHLKQVGVAIYATGEEDISQIQSKIKNYTDFIHVDIIDESYNASKKPKLSRFEVIKAYWPSKQVDVHIMSKTPSIYLDRIIADLVIVHFEIEDNLKEVLLAIRERGMRAGICLQMHTPILEIKPYIGLVDTVMLLTIPQPGHSGQYFQHAALGRINELNGWPERSRFTLCVDGGVSEKNIGMLSVDKVVSGSSVLTHRNPARQIMRLQTSSVYEKIR